MQKRIEYIDLAKGVCILLVLLSHVEFLPYNSSSPISNTGSTFRMPFYYFLSGCFFKTYSNFKEFARKKTNRLVVPFLFWHLLLSIALPVLLNLFYTGTISLLPAKDNFLKIIHNEIPYNVAVWFLLSLFVINILFFGIVWLIEKIPTTRNDATITAGVQNQKPSSRKLFQDEKLVAITIALSSIVCGFIGWILRTNSIALPLFIDTAFSAMPYFAGGYLLCKHTTLLTSTKKWKSGIILAIALIPLIILYNTHVYALDLRRNLFFINTPMAYLCGFAGIFFLISLCNILGHLPIVSYMGKYSIIVLVLHCPIIMISASIVDTLLPHQSISIRVIILSAIVLCLCVAAIPFCRKHLPKFTAQKDLF